MVAIVRNLRARGQQTPLGYNDFPETLVMNLVRACSLITLVAALCQSASAQKESRPTMDGIWYLNVDTARAAARESKQPLMVVFRCEKIADCKAFDAQVRNASGELLELERQFVCVRVTNMTGIDLNLFRFDYDLTFAVLFLSPEGGTYHRYGSRDDKSAEGRLSQKGLISVMKDTLSEHVLNKKSGGPAAPAGGKRTVDDIPVMAKRFTRRRPSCVGCHMVNDGERDQLVADKAWQRDMLWRWPRPERIGIELDRDDPTLIKKVIEGANEPGPASMNGLEPGEHLTKIGDVVISSEADAQWALEQAPHAASNLPVEWRHGAAQKNGGFILGRKWREADVLDIAWRWSFVGLRPNPGFRAEQLNAAGLKYQKLPEGSWAVKVTRFDNETDRPEQANAAMKAGLHIGDVIYDVDDKTDFASDRHFQMWFRTTREPGNKVRIRFLRDHKENTIEYPILE